MTDCETQRHTICLAVNAASKSATRFFTPGNVSTCVNQTNTVYAKAITSQATQADLDDLTDKCAYVFQGTVASGAPCTIKYECKDKNQICDTKNGTSLCSTKVQKSKGQPCGNHGEYCTDDSYCAMDATTGSYTCMAKGAQGAACSATVPCIDTLRCDASGLCTMLIGQGMFCGSSADCVATASYCDPYNSCKCDPGLSFATGAVTCVDYGGSPNSNVPACGAGSSPPDAGTISPPADASSGG
jgi:hypothetical protein